MAPLKTTPHRPDTARRDTTAAGAEPSSFASMFVRHSLDLLLVVDLLLLDVGGSSFWGRSGTGRSFHSVRGRERTSGLGEVMGRGGRVKTGTRSRRPPCRGGLERRVSRLLGLRVLGLESGCVAVLQEIIRVVRGRVPGVPLPGHGSGPKHPRPVTPTSRSDRTFYDPHHTRTRLRSHRTVTIPGQLRRHRWPTELETPVTGRELEHPRPDVGPPNRPSYTRDP